MLRSVLLAALAVTGWRMKVVLVDANARSGGEIDGAELLLRVALAVVGLVFVVCAVTAVTTSRGTPTRLFAGWALAAGLHWGGALYVGQGAMRAAVLVGYVVVSGLLAHALLVHFALSWPRPLRFPGRPGVLAALYLPIVIALALGALVVPAAEGHPDTAVRWAALLGLDEAVSTLLAAVAVVLFVARAVRSPAADGRLVAVATAAVASFLPMAVGMLLSESTGWAGPAGLGQRPLALFLVILPLVAARRLALGSDAVDSG